MYLTTQNAHRYVGKTLDAKRRLFHHYPLTVHKRNGEYYFSDITNTWMFVPDEKDRFNTVWFDDVVSD